MRDGNEHGADGGPNEVGVLGAAGVTDETLCCAVNAVAAFPLSDWTDGEEGMLRYIWAVG